MAEINERAQIAAENQQAFSLNILQLLVDKEWRVISANNAAKEEFSTHCDQLLGSNFRSVLLGIDSNWSNSLPECLRGEKDMPTLFLAWDPRTGSGMGWDLQFLPADGRVYITLVPQLAPEVSGTISEEGLAGDGGALNATLRTLFLRMQQQEMRFRHFMRHLPGAHFTQGRDLQFSFINDCLINLLGASCIAMLRSGTHWWEWVHPTDLPEFNKNLKLCHDGCVPVSFRFRLVLPDEDRVLYLMDLRMPVRGLDGKLAGYEGLWLDLTRETLAEKRLQQASWKESLAEVSGSLSHDFNNILTGICSLANLVYESTPSDAPQADYLKLIRDSSQQAQGLIQRIVSLNREESGQVLLHNLGEIVKNQQELIRIILPKDTNFTLSVPDEELAVRLDAVAIRRILLNFATNARDAIGRRGSVSLSLRKVDLANYDRKDLLSGCCGNSGEAAELVFHDDGCGIDPAILHRIFGPYFSTKDSTRGSGLGLYSVTQFARKNGFDFGVRSKPGVGTEMILLIPLEEIDFAEDVGGWEDSFDPAANFISHRVAVFGKQDALVRSVMEHLHKHFYHIDLLYDEDEALEWVQSSHKRPRVFIQSIDCTSVLPRRLCDALAVTDASVLSVLCLKGLNPDRFNNMLGGAFNHIFLDEDCPADVAGLLLSFMDSETAMVKPVVAFAQPGKGDSK